MLKSCRYRQYDNMNLISKGDYFLVLFIQRYVDPSSNGSLHRVDVFSSLEDRGDAGVFVTIEWQGMVARTKMLKKP